MKAILITISLFFFSCEEGFVQPFVVIHDPPKEEDVRITVQYAMDQLITTYYANGSDRLRVTIDMEDNIKEEVEVAVKTQSGKLYTEEGWGTFESGVQELSIKSKNGAASCFYLVGTIPGKNVVSIKVGEFEYRKEIKLERAEATGIYLTANRKSVKADGKDAVTLKAKVHSISGVASKGTKVRLIGKTGSEQTPEDIYYRESYTDDSGNAKFELVGYTPSDEVTFTALTGEPEISSKEVVVVKFN